MNERLRDARLIALACAALILFTYPVLAAFDTGRLVLGVPANVLYLFGVWALIIAATAWIGRRR